MQYICFVWVWQNAYTRVALAGPFRMQPQSQRKAQRRGGWAEPMVWPYGNIKTHRNLDTRKLPSKHNPSNSAIFFPFHVWTPVGGCIHQWFKVTGGSVIQMGAMDQNWDQNRVLPQLVCFLWQEWAWQICGWFDVSNNHEQKGHWCRNMRFDGRASPTSQTNYSHTERVDFGLDHPKIPTQAI